MFLPQGSYSLAARARLQPLHGAREPTACVACSGEAVQGCAKANANRIELVELENVIGDHPREGLTEGPVSAQPSDRASAASRRMVVLGVTKLGGLLCVLVSRAQPASCEGSRTHLMRRSVVKARSVRGVACPIFRFNHLHWRPFPEGWWRFDRRIEELQDIFTKIYRLGEDGVPGRPRSSFVTEVSQSGSTTCCRCQIHSAHLPMSFASVSVLTRIWCSV